MGLDQLHWGWQALIALSLVIGGVFALVGAIGMLRFPDFYMRLHGRPRRPRWAWAACWWPAWPTTGAGYLRHP